MCRSRAVSATEEKGRWTGIGRIFSFPFLRFRLSAFRPRVRYRCLVLVGLEGAQAAPAPSRQQISRAFPLAFLCLPLEARGEFQEGAEEGGAIVVHQIDEAGLLNQATELDQMPGARPPV